MADVEMSKAEFERAMEQAVSEAKIEALGASFRQHEEKESQYLKEIFNKIREIQKDVAGWPLRMNECSDALEHDLLEQIEETYMTKKDGKLLEQHLSSNIKSIKVWIVSSVGGFTGAGLLILWALRLIGET